jgi:hypothetical protein
LLTLIYRVRSLSIVIQDADVVLSECEPNAKQKTELQEIIGSCHKILSDLEKILDKYDELETRGGNLGKRVKRVGRNSNGNQRISGSFEIGSHRMLHCSMHTLHGYPGTYPYLSLARCQRLN